VGCGVEEAWESTRRMSARAETLWHAPKMRCVLLGTGNLFLALGVSEIVDGRRSTVPMFPFLSS